MNIAIPEEPYWHVPEGFYRSHLVDIQPRSQKQTARGPVEQVRLVFEIDYPRPQRLLYMAGKLYEKSFEKGKALRNDLATWRGRDFEEDELEQGRFDFNHMLHQPADLEIVHVHNAAYAKPYVLIKGIFVPGTLVRDAQGVA